MEPSPYARVPVNLERGAEAATRAATPEHLLRVAGRALYAAEHAGRDGVMLAAAKPDLAPAA